MSQIELLPDRLVQRKAAVRALAQTLDLPKGDISNRVKPAALCRSCDGPIPEVPETRRAARATDEAKQLRAKEEHEHHARHSQHRNESAADDWCKQVNRGANADDIANAQKPVPSLVLRISKVFPQRHVRRFYDQRSPRTIGMAHGDRAARLASNCATREALSQLPPEIVSHCRQRVIQVHGAIWAVFHLRAEHAECGRHRNGLAESGPALGAADKQERDDRTHEAEYADEGKVARSRSPEAHVPREDDEQPRDNSDAKSPSHSALDVIADRHCSLPRVFVQRFVETQTAVNTPLRLWRLISKRRNGVEPDKSSASGTASSADVGQIDNAAQEPRAESDVAERCPRTILSVVTKHTDPGQQERHGHDLYPVLATINKSADGHGLHGPRFYPAVGIAP
jgi:hypothetical protein